VRNVSAVDGSDAMQVAIEISNCDIMATAVGVNILPKIIPNILLGLKRRWSEKNYKPLNIIICENMLDANIYVENLIKDELTTGEKVLFDKYVGIVEASIGRMVPIMTEEMQEGNILKVWVEEYCELPLDRAAFKGELPEISHMITYSPFEFFIQLTFT
jgi:mannitol-1-phosphate 5-dehydrogenase